MVRIEGQWACVGPALPLLGLRCSVNIQVEKSNRQGCGCTFFFFLLLAVLCSVWNFPDQGWDPSSLQRKLRPLDHQGSPSTCPSWPPPGEESRMWSRESCWDLDANWLLRVCTIALYFLKNYFFKSYLDWIQEIFTSINYLLGIVLGAEDKTLK